MIRRARDLTGQTFSAWTVIKRSPGAQTMWQARCTCGEIRSVRATSLTTGRSQSCGCSKRDNASLPTTIHDVNDQRTAPPDEGVLGQGPPSNNV
jgi:hypothetical protein